jgi:hypothetical protein
MAWLKSRDGPHPRRDYFDGGNGARCRVPRYPSCKPTIEFWGGGCLVGGIALIGLPFPMI